MYTTIAGQNSKSLSTVHFSTLVSPLPPSFPPFFWFCFFGIYILREREREVIVVDQSVRKLR